MLVKSNCLNLLPQQLQLLEENFGLSYSKSMYFYDKNMRYKRVFLRYFRKVLFFFVWEFPERYSLSYFTRSLWRGLCSLLQRWRCFKEKHAKTSRITLFLQYQTTKSLSYHLWFTLNQMRASQWFLGRREHGLNMGEKGISLLLNGTFTKNIREQWCLLLGNKGKQVHFQGVEGTFYP